MVYDFGLPVGLALVVRKPVIGRPIAVTFEVVRLEQRPPTIGERALTQVGAYYATVLHSLKPRDPINWSKFSRDDLDGIRINGIAVALVEKFGGRYEPNVIAMKAGYQEPGKSWGDPGALALAGALFRSMEGATNA